VEKYRSRALGEHTHTQRDGLSVSFRDINSFVHFSWPFLSQGG